MTSGSFTTIANPFIKDVMTRDVPTLTPSASIDQVRPNDERKECRHGALPVSEGTYFEATLREAMTADVTDLPMKTKRWKRPYGSWLADKFAARRSSAVRQLSQRACPWRYRHPE